VATASLTPNATISRSAGSDTRRGTSSSIALLTVAPESPTARQATGRPVKRASARAVVADTVSSPRATPTPETEESPIARMRNDGPARGKNPRCGGFAAGRDGIRRRVAVPCTTMSGNSASEPKTPAASLTRDPVLPSLENLWARTGLTVGRSCKRRTILVAAVRQN
jgi:hypothetical protein